MGAGSRNHGRLWRWAAWFVAVGSALPHTQADAIAAQPAARVATGEEFSAALRKSVPHIVITEHLDLTGLVPEFEWPEDVGGAALFHGACSADVDAVGSLGSGTLSIRGGCDDTGPPPTARLGDAARKKGQCVLTVGRLTLFVWQCKSDSLWIDNLYIRSQTVVMDFHRMSEPIRITNVTVQHTTGAGPAEAKLGSWFVHRSSFWLHGVDSFLLEGCVFRGLDKMILQAQEADVCLASCSAEGLALADPTQAAVQSGVSDDDVFPLGRVGPARFKLVDCTLDVANGFVLGDDRPDDDFDAVFYTDHPTTETSGDDGWLVQPDTDVQPVEAGSDVSWLTTDSEEFLELRRVSSTAAAMASAALQPEAAAPAPAPLKDESDPALMPEDAAAAPNAGAAPTVRAASRGPFTPSHGSTSGSGGRDGDVSAGVVIGAVIGAVALAATIAALAIVVALRWRRKKRRDVTASGVGTGTGTRSRGRPELEPMSHMRRHNSAAFVPEAGKSDTAEFVVIPDAPEHGAAGDGRAYTSGGGTTGPSSPSRVIAGLGTSAGSTKRGSHSSCASELAPLLAAVEAMALAQPHKLFAGAYVLTTSSMAHGGQGLVVFAREQGATLRQYAVKFCLSHADFASEVAVYRDDLFRSCLPDLAHATDNADGLVTGPGGYVFPPFLVLDRGVTLQQWVEQQRAHSAVVTMAAEVAAMLGTLHRAGRVHRDLKPGNLLLVLHTQVWRLLDFGIVAAIGRNALVSCTPGYAAPEALVAYSAGVRLEVLPSLDIWSLGVVVYECLTRAPLFPTFEGVQPMFSCARGDTPYPWELPRDKQPEAWRRARTRGLFERCLSRDAALRPSALEVLQGLHKLDCAVSHVASLDGVAGTTRGSHATAEAMPMESCETESKA